MSKVLMGAIAKSGKVEATYRYTVFGATKVGTKSDGWPSAVTDAAAALVAAADAEAGDFGAVVSVQVYTAITDPDGAPGFSAPGELVDITFAPSSTPASVRVGDDETIPESIATARDAFKAAVQAAL